MPCAENAAGFLLAFRPVLMTGIVTPLIVSIPLCRGTAAVLNLARVAETSSALHLLARFRQKMSALIRDEYRFAGSFPCCHGRGARPCCEKNYTSRPALQHLSQADFLHFSLRPIRPRDSVEKLPGKILIHRLNHARVIGAETVRREKKLKSRHRS